MDILIRKFETGDPTKDFDCGNESLNEYLRRYAPANQRRMFGVTYVAICSHPSPTRVIGYFTIANTSIPRSGIPESLLKGLPKYQDLPAFLLGRLAVAKEFQGKHIGEALLIRCFESCLTVAKISGARYLIADVKPAAIGWYERFNFRKIEGGQHIDSIKMFVDLEVVKSAIDHKAGPPSLN